MERVVSKTALAISINYTRYREATFFFPTGQSPYIHRLLCSGLYQCSKLLLLLHRQTLRLESTTLGLFVPRRSMPFRVLSNLFQEDKNICLQNIPVCTALKTTLIPKKNKTQIFLFISPLLRNPESS